MGDWYALVSVERTVFGNVLEMKGLDKFVADICVDPVTVVGESTLNGGVLLDCVLPDRILGGYVLLGCENDACMLGEDVLGICALDDPIPDKDMLEASVFDDCELREA